MNSLEVETRALKQSFANLQSSSEKDAREFGTKLASEKSQAKTLMAQMEELKTLLDNEKEDKAKLNEQLEKAKEGAEERIAADKDKYWQDKLQEELRSQKSRYEAKVKSISDQITSKYKAKIEECIEKWNNDISDKDAKMAKERSDYEKRLQDYKANRNNFEERYELAKKKLGDLSSALNETSSELKTKESENAQFKKKLTLMEVKVAEMEANRSDRLNLENQQLQQEVKKLSSQNRSLQVQFNAADARIRELQRPSKSTSSLPSRNRHEDKQPSANESGLFKMPSSVKNTPGRTRASRTQSEVSMARRPPQGSGACFKMDEEAGEIFSSSYLTDLQAGRCDLDHTGRMSELARRNTLQPAHLKSSYPAETQFRPLHEFADDDLRSGKIKELSDATANMSMDSPAMNTRRQSSVRLSISSITSAHRKAESTPLNDHRLPSPPSKPRNVPAPIKFEISPFKPAAAGLRQRKRASLSKTDVENADVKRARKELSYSKPGPPTPARRHNRSGNTSLNTSGKSVASNTSILTTGSNVSSKRIFR